jgi:hypothetical protein
MADHRFRQRLHDDAFRQFAAYWQRAPVSARDVQLDEQAVVGAADSVIIPLIGVLTVESDLEEFVEAYKPGTRIFPRHDPVTDQPRTVVTVPIEIPRAHAGGDARYASYAPPGRAQSPGAGKLQWLFLAAFASVSFALLQTTNGMGALSVLLTGQ